jgi:hypothetical protein
MAFMVLHPRDRERERERGAIGLAPTDGIGLSSIGGAREGAGLNGSA